MAKKRPYRKRCACGLVLVGGACPAGCDAHVKPQLRARSLGKTLREREKRGLRT